MLNLIYIVLASYATVAWFWIIRLKRLLQYNKSKIYYPINSVVFFFLENLNSIYTSKYEESYLKHGLESHPQSCYTRSNVARIWQVVFIIYFPASIYLICLCETQRWPYDIIFSMRYIYNTFVKSLFVVVVEFGGGGCIWF